MYRSTTSGKSRLSPEVLITLICGNYEFILILAEISYNYRRKSISYLIAYPTTLQPRTKILGWFLTIYDESDLKISSSYAATVTQLVEQDSYSYTLRRTVANWSKP